MSRLDRKEDTFGTGASHEFISVPLQAAEQYVKYKPFGIAYFLVGSWILEQTEGVPIGGPISAQCAVLYMILQERGALRTGFFQWRLLQGRYRDNLYIFGKLAELQEQKAHCMQTLEAVYGMKLQEEQIGHTVDVLEVTVTLDPKTEAEIRLRPKVLDWQTGRLTAIRRWPDAISSNVQDVLPSLSIRAAWKSKYWATNRHDKLSNIVTVLTECGMKG